jgi:hypothetical protein
MANLVGDKPLTPQKREKLVAQLKDILEQLRPHGVMLNKDSRKRTLRPRKGAEPHMQRVHDLAIKHGVSLKNISLDGMAADLELAKQFQAIEDEARTVLTFAEDTGTQAGSEGWEAFLAYYGVLSSIADRNPELATELEPVVKFMANGPRQQDPPVEK